jgi:hypothetical protein
VTEVNGLAVSRPLPVFLPERLKKPASRVYRPAGF